MEHLRGHKANAKNKLQVEKVYHDDQVSYDEMIPGSPRKKDLAKSKALFITPVIYFNKQMLSSINFYNSIFLKKIGRCVKFKLIFNCFLDFE